MEKEAKKEQIELEVFKYYYEYWKQANWQTEKIKNIRTPELDISTIRKGALTYATKYLNIPKEEFYQTLELNRKLKRNMLTPSLFILFEKLSDETEEQEIIKLIDSSETNLKVILEKIPTYAIKYRTEEYKQILKKLRHDITIYRQKDIKDKKDIKKQEIDEEKLKRAHRIIMSYAINDTATKEDICQEANITSQEFEEYVNLIKENESMTYTILLHKIEKERAKQIETLKQNIPDIIKTLREKPQDFTILDYYSLTTIPVEEFDLICKKMIDQKELSSANYILLNSKFIAKNKDMKPCTEHELNTLLDERMILNAKLDKNDQYIENSGTEVTREEKLDIIETLKEKNIPITQKIYKKKKKKAKQRQKTKTKNKK